MSDTSADAAMTPSRYAAYPDHPLAPVPQEILDAARTVMRAEVVCCGDVGEDAADPIADLMVMAVAPWLTWPGKDSV